MDQGTGKGNYYENIHRFSLNALQDDLDVRGLFLTLWRRRFIIIGVMILGVCLAAVITNFLQPRYNARGLVLFEKSPNEEVASDILALFNTYRVDTTLVMNEIEVLRSRTLARQVVEKLNLIEDPEFNPRPIQGTEVKTDLIDENLETADVVPTFKTLNIGGVDSLDADYLPYEDARLAATITRFQSKMKVRSIPGSYVMQVEFTSIDANKAAGITNTILDTYIEMRLFKKFEAAQKVSGWLDNRLGSLKEQVRESERAVQEYMEANDLVSGVRSALSTEQISELTSQLVGAKAKLAEAEARYKQVKEAGKNLQKIEASPVVANSPLIQELKRSEVELQRRLSDLSNQYGERHPTIIKAKAELKSLRKSLRDEMFKVAKSIEGELKVAHARVKALEEGMDQVGGRKHRENQARIQLRELEREAESSRLIFDNFLATYKRSDQREELQDADARVISYAVVAQRPSYPNKLLILSLASTISLFIGLALAFLLEKLDNTFRSAGQLENMAGYPCYALIPGIQGMSQPEVVNYIVEKPSSTIAESVRTLRTVLNLRSEDNEDTPKIVTITSSFPGEGKTTLSTWIARLAAKSGERVILIDADLRRPNVHRSLQRSNEHSLVEYLTGQETLEEVVQVDEESGMHVIFGRSVPNSALDLVSSQKMKKLLDALKETYDLVIVDSPACLAVSDSRVLATMSDQTLYIVAWDKTPREVVLSGIKQFTDINYKSMSFVLSNVDVKRHVKYGYGDTMYYYGRYQEYYTA